MMRAEVINVLRWVLCFYLLLPVISEGVSNSQRWGHRSSRSVGVKNKWIRRLEASNVIPCARSWLGYQCTQLVCGRIRMHWSLGGDPPGPGCAYPQNGTQATAADPTSQLLHVALQTDFTGYVAMSWPQKAGSMAKADAVIGFLGAAGAASVKPYKILSDSGKGVIDDSSVDITNTGLEVNATALTICFTRNTSQVGQGARISISVEQAQAMNFVASAASFGQVHSLHSNYVCGVSMVLLRALGGPDDGGWRPSNVSTAVADNVLTERLNYMRTHGALMFTGWIVLVPTGILAARHRWVFAPLSGIVGLWFQVHRAVQVAATVLIAAGFVLPWTSFNSNDEEALLGIDHAVEMASDSLLELHMTLAILLMTVLGLHILVAMLRPKPDASKRWIWNLVHWWTGRGLAVVAGINVAIGIALWRRVSGGSGVEWIVPLVLLAVGWVALAVWLERRGPSGLGRDGGGGGGKGTAGADAALYIGFGSTPSWPVPSAAGSVLMTPVPAAPGAGDTTTEPNTYVSNGLVYTKL